MQADPNREGKLCIGVDALSRPRVNRTTTRNGIMAQVDLAFDVVLRDNRKRSAREGEKLYKDLQRAGLALYSTIATSAPA